MADTMGYAFTFHVVSILTGVKVGAYVHYPTISTEMIRRVESRVALHNNSASVSSSTFLTHGKLLSVLSLAFEAESSNFTSILRQLLSHIHGFLLILPP
jgi:hypothetical protein